MPTHDQDVRKAYSNYSTLNNLFDQTPLPSTYNFAFLIDLLGKARKLIGFNDVVPIILKFTNNLEFRDHYQESRNNFKLDPNGQFYSFISALNELGNKRYEYLQSFHFYLKLSIPFDVILEKQNELFQKNTINKEQIETKQYIIDFKKSVEKINEFEKNEINKFINNGFEISQVLKWTEKDGITASTIAELNEHKNSKIQQKVNVKTIKNENSDFIIRDIKNIVFPEKLTIKSLYDTFKDVKLLTYDLTYIIYSLKKNRLPLNRARILLNQLIAIFLWQNECSVCFPFKSFTKHFNTAFSSVIHRLYNSKLRIINFPLFLLEKSEFHEFVQIPSLNVTRIYNYKFTRPGLANNLIEFKPIQNNKLKKLYSGNEEEE